MSRLLAQALFPIWLLALLIGTVGARAADPVHSLGVMAWSGAGAGTPAADAASSSQRGCSSIVGCIEEVRRQIEHSGANEGGEGGQPSAVADAVFVVDLVPAQTINADGTMLVKATVADRRLDFSGNVPAATKKQIEAEARVVQRNLGTWSRKLTLAEVKILIEQRQMRIPVVEPFAPLKLLSKPSVFLVIAGPEQGSADECSLLMAQRHELERKLGDLLAQKLPDERLEEILGYLRMIKEVAGNTNKDAKERSDQISKISAQVKKAFPKIGKALDRIAKGVKGTAQKLGKVVEFIDKITPALEAALEIARNADAGSAAQQIRDLRRTFDGIRSTLPVNEVPGLGDLFNAYSQAIEGIASSVTVWEQAMDRFAKAAKDADELHRDFVIRPRGLREQRADAITKAQAALKDLDRRLEAAGCKTAAAPVGLCDKTREHVDRIYNAALAAAQPLKDLANDARRAKEAAGTRVGQAYAERVEKADRLAALRLKITTWGGSKTVRLYQDMVKEAAALEQQRAALKKAEDDAQAEYDRKSAEETVAIRRWRDAVQDELAKTEGWTSEDLDYLRFCKPDGFLPGGGY